MDPWKMRFLLGNHPFFRCELLVSGRKKSIIVTISKRLEFLDGIQPFFFGCFKCAKEKLVIFHFLHGDSEVGRVCSVVRETTSSSNPPRFGESFKQKRCHFHQFSQISNLIIFGKKNSSAKVASCRVGTNLTSEVCMLYPMYPHFFVNYPRTSTKNLGGLQDLYLVQKSELCTCKVREKQQKTLQFIRQFWWSSSKSVGR